jgi:hypothetical protein
MIAPGMKRRPAAPVAEGISPAECKVTATAANKSQLKRNVRKKNFSSMAEPQDSRTTNIDVSEL